MAEKKLPAVLAAIPTVVPTQGDAFTMTIGNKTVDMRSDAVAGIYDWVKTNTPAYGNFAHRQHDYGTMAVLGGQELVVSNAATQSRLGSYQDLLIQVKGLPDTATVFSRQEILEAGTGMVTKLENRVTGIPEIAAKLQRTIAEKQLVSVEIDAQLGKPFKYEDKLADAREKSKELDAKLKASLEPAEAKNTQPEGGQLGNTPLADPRLEKALKAQAFAQSQVRTTRPQPAAVNPPALTTTPTSSPRIPGKAPTRDSPGRGIS